MRINGDIHLKYPLKYIYAKSTVKWTTHLLTFLVMLNVPAFMNLYNLNFTSIPSHQNIINYTTEHNKDKLWVIPTPEQQQKGGINTSRNSNTAHLQILTSIKIILVKDGHLVTFY